MAPSDDEEEGELPFDQPVHDGKGGDQESGEASGFDEGEVMEEGAADEDEKPPHLMPGASNVGLAHRQRGASRVMLSPREGVRGSPVGEGPGGLGGGGPAPRGEEGHPRGGGNTNINGISSEHREREELQSLLRELTRYVSVQDAMRSLDTVCQDLKKAIKKLDKLLRVCKRKKGEDVEAYPECFAFSKKIMEGLKSVHLVVGTSIGHTKRMEGVLMLFKAAMNYRHDVLAVNQKQELESWVRGSKVLKVIVEEKERAKAESARAAAAPEGTPGVGEGSTPTPGPERTPGPGVDGGGERAVAAEEAKGADGTPDGANKGEGLEGVAGGAQKDAGKGVPQEGDTGERPLGENGAVAQQQGGDEEKVQTHTTGRVGAEAHTQAGEGRGSHVHGDVGEKEAGDAAAAGEAGVAGQGLGGRVQDGGELRPPPLPVQEDAPPPPTDSDAGPTLPPQLPNGMGPSDSPSRAPMPPPPPPPSSPPPPSEPYPEHHSPMSEDPLPQQPEVATSPTQPHSPEQHQQQHQQQQAHRPTVLRIGTGGGRGGAKPAASHAASSAFKFKIVVESSASDIRRANMQKAAAAATAASTPPAEPAIKKDKQAKTAGDGAAEEVATEEGGKGGGGDGSGGGAEDKGASAVAGEGGRRERRRGREHVSTRTCNSDDGDEEGRGKGQQGPGTEGVVRSGKEREHRREREREKDSKRGRSRGGKEKEGEGGGEGQLQGSAVGGSHSKRSHRSSRSPDGGREGRSSKRMRADADGPSGRDKHLRHCHERSERSERGWGPPPRGSSSDRLGGVHGHRGRSRDRFRDPSALSSDHPGFSRGRPHSRDRLAGGTTGGLSRDHPEFSRGRSRDRALDLLDLPFSRGRSRERGVGGLLDVGFSRGRSREGWDGPACDMRGGRDRSRSRGRSKRKASRSVSRNTGRARSWERPPANINAPSSPPLPTSSPQGIEDPAVLLDLFSGGTSAAAPASGPSFPPESPLSDEEPDGGGLASLEPAPAPSAPTGWTFEQRQKDRMVRDKGDLACALERGVASAAAAAAADADGIAPALALEREDARKSPSSGDEASPLLQQGRMVLALDLDHTLLSSARLTELEPETEAQLAQRQAAELSSEASDHQRELFRSERLGIWTKLRPGVREFLAKAAEKFELWVYSSGSKPYAEAMAGLLDPDDRLFQGRLVIAGGGADGPHGLTAAQNARLMSALQQRGSVAIALDEADAQWPSEARLALFVVERYLFFPSNRRRYGMQGRSLLEINRDESPDRGMLMTALPLLERLHTLVLTYANHPGPAGQLLSAPPAEPRLPPWDIRNVLADERRKVLAGVSLSFSRIIPTGMEPWLHPLWKMAEAYGARCSARCEDSITHVVASSRGTEKTCWAAQHGRAVVTPAWLECCSSLWRKANEERFATPL